MRRMAAAAAAAVAAAAAASSLEDLFHTHPIVGSLSIPPSCTQVDGTVLAISGNHTEERRGKRPPF